MASTTLQFLDDAAAALLTATGRKFNSKKYIAQNYNYQEIAPTFALR